MGRKLQCYVRRVCNGEKLYILYRHVILRVALLYIQKFFRSLKKTVVSHFEYFEDFMLVYQKITIYEVYI